MATRLYSVDPGTHLEDVVEAVGSPIVTKHIELTVDLGATIVTADGGTRGILKEEVLIALEIFKEYIVRSNWPPA